MTWPPLYSNLKKSQKILLHRFNVQKLDQTTFKSHGSLISYFNTIPWQKSLTKSRAWRCLWRRKVIVCQPIKTIFSIRVQWIIFTFHISTTKIFVYTMRGRLISSIICLWNQSNTFVYCGFFYTIKACL